jgi:hypothetical protein
MNTETLSIARRDDRSVDPWTLLTGGSVGIVAGFGVDLLRLGLHASKRAIAGGTRSGAARRWPCPACSAGSR